MMWRLFIVLIATAAAASDESEEDRPSCRRLIRIECETDEEKPQDFPVTEEELEYFCKYALKFTDCTDRVLSDCEADENFNQYIGELATTIRRVCKEDSLIRPAIVEVLPCLKEYRDTIASCHRTVHVDIDSFADALKEAGVTDIDEFGDSPTGRCLNVLFISGCLAASSSLLCGDTARDVVINLIQDFDSTFESCPEGVKESLPTIVNVLEMEAAKAEAMENTIKRKK